MRHLMGLGKVAHAERTWLREDPVGVMVRRAEGVWRRLERASISILAQTWKQSLCGTAVGGLGAIGCWSNEGRPYAEHDINFIHQF